MSNGVGIVDGVLTQKSSDVEYERDRFVRENPDYGYGLVDNISASSASSSTSSTSFIDRSSNIGSCKQPSINVAASGPKIDFIRQRDFPRLLRPMVVSPTAPSGTPGGHQQHQHQWKPGSIDASKREGALVYLDHAGATLFGASQLAEAMGNLLGGVHGNPHSQGPVSSTTATRLDFTRHSVLRHFGASSQDWSVVFTSGATAALKTVGEQFPWRPGGTFVHARSSHNSVLGIREYAREGGADVECLDLEDCAWLTAGGKATAAAASPRSCRHGCRSLDGAEHQPAAPTLENRAVGGDAPDADSLAGVASPGDSNSHAKGNASPPGGGIGEEHSDDEEDVQRTVDCLFAFPAECNATGARPDLGIASRVKRGALSSERRRRRCRRANRDRFSKESADRWTNGEVEEGEGQGRSFDTDGRDRTKNSCAEERGGPTAPWGAVAEQLPAANTRGRERWWVLLDAAKFVGTAPLDLSKVEADFVTVSFYKIFGYPTGLGALLIRESAARVLRKCYFGGGTVLAALADSPFRRFRPEAERRLADGTEHFLGVLALEAGFRTLRSLGGMGAIAAHTSCLARYLHARLSTMRHANGDPVVRIFGRWRSQRLTQSEREDSSTTSRARPGDGTGGSTDGGGAKGGAEPAGVGQGPVLAMCFLRPGGDFVGHVEVEKMAEVENIQLRAGSFCNPGACQRALGLNDRDVKEHLERGHVCWDDHDLIDGRPTGLVRVSLGWMSTWEDANAFASFVSRHFVVRKPPETNAQRGETQPDPDGGVSKPEGLVPPNHALLEAIYIYPIKSCAPQRAGASLLHRRPVKSPSSTPPVVVETVTSLSSTGMAANSRSGTKGRAVWPLGPSGLAYDREWALVDHRNRALRLKQIPAMCKIRPFVDLLTRTLTVSAPGMPDLVLPLGWESSEAAKEAGEHYKAGASRPLGGHGYHGGGGSDCEEIRGVDVPMIVRVCGNRRAGIACTASASAWFTRFLGEPCSLVRAAAVDVSASVSPSHASDDGKNTSVENPGGKRCPNGTSGVCSEGSAHDSPLAEMETPKHAAAAAAAERAFANEAQYLLISRASVDRVNDVIRESSLMADGRLTGDGSGDLGRGNASQEKVTTGHFRPNFVVNGVRAHEEDGWRSVTFGDSLSFRVTGPCSRCSMINIDPETGDTSGVALKVLATYRRQRANIVFGQFLSSADTVVPPRPVNGVRKPGLDYDDDGSGNVSGSLGWKAWVWEGMEVCGAP